MQYNVNRFVNGEYESLGAAVVFWPASEKPFGDFDLRFYLLFLPAVKAGIEPLCTSTAAGSGTDETRRENKRRANRTFFTASRSNKSEPTDSGGTLHHVLRPRPLSRGGAGFSEWESGKKQGGHLTALWYSLPPPPSSSPLLRTSNLF